MNHIEACGNCIQVCQALIIDLSRCAKECKNGEDESGSCLKTVKKTLKVIDVAQQTIDACTEHITLCTMQDCIDLCNKCIVDCKELQRLCKNTNQQCESANDSCTAMVSKTLDAAELCINACRNSMDKGCRNS